MLFHRDFTEYTGGHGKVWDYFRHALALGWDARVHLTPRSLRDDRNPWSAHPELIEPEWNPEACDVLFLAGMDWAALPDPCHPPRPVVNLVQHVRHAWPDHPLHAFLEAPAQRICVSRPVAEALQATNRVNGGLCVIPAALDLPELPAMAPQVRHGRVVIAALKAPGLGQELARVLRDREMDVELLDSWLPRREYLERVSRGAVVVTLPHAVEGFYLPALEAMSLGVPVVMTDCIGSREYVRDSENCVLAAAQPEALAAAVERARQPELAHRLQRGGLLTAAAYGQERERERFAQVMRRMEGNEP